MCHIAILHILLLHKERVVLSLPITWLSLFFLSFLFIFLLKFRLVEPFLKFVPIHHHLVEHLGEGIYIDGAIKRGAGGAHS